MRSLITVSQYLVGIVGALTFIACTMLGLSDYGPRTEVTTAPAAQGMFSPYATLDTSSIDDLRGRGYALDLDTGEVLLVPGGTVLETTPMVPVPDTAYVVPEESPEDGYPLGYEAWLENSPMYSDGWVLLVDDVQHDVQWRAPATTCSTDLDCSQRMPHIAPDGHTARAYWSTWDAPRFPTTGDCSRVDWHHGGEDSGPIVPADLDDDGVIDCASDLELGA